MPTVGARIVENSLATAIRPRMRVRLVRTCGRIADIRRTAPSLFVQFEACITRRGGCTCPQRGQLHVPARCHPLPTRICAYIARVYWRLLTACSSYRYIGLSGERAHSPGLGHLAAKRYFFDPRKRVSRLGTREENNTGRIHKTR